MALDSLTIIWTWHDTSLEGTWVDLHVMATLNIPPCCQAGAGAGVGPAPPPARREAATEPEPVIGEGPGSRQSDTITTAETMVDSEDGKKFAIQCSE